MKFDVLVVGAGLAGAALAAALRGSNLKVGIVEARPPARPAGWDPRIYAISPANAACRPEMLRQVWGTALADWIAK